jgi:hypothetical protein
MVLRIDRVEEEKLEAVGTLVGCPVGLVGRVLGILVGCPVGCPVGRLHTVPPITEIGP